MFDQLDSSRAGVLSCQQFHSRLVCTMLCYRHVIYLDLHIHSLKRFAQSDWGIDAAKIELAFMLVDADADGNVWPAF
eukprot:SAG11_NODE_12429_length_704_cov_0.763636_2_plen_76_part_01